MFYTSLIDSYCLIVMFDVTESLRSPMITAAQLRAARGLLGIDQRRLAELSGLSVPTIQRMEASESMVRGNVDSLVKLITAFDAAGIEMINEGASSHSQGRGVRLKIASGSAKPARGPHPKNKTSAARRTRA
jgi:transcriptional regulator with XRE-family HTH domain